MFFNCNDLYLAMITEQFKAIMNFYLLVVAIVSYQLLFFYVKYCTIVIEEHVNMFFLNLAKDFQRYCFC